MTELKDCNLQFPDISPIDHVKSCPKYASIISRSKSEGIAVDELDSLQMELEHLLAAASQRMRQIKAEIEVLSDSQDGSKKEKKTSKGKDVEYKRSRAVDDRPVKKMKVSEGGHHSPHVAKTAGSHLNTSTASPSGGRSKAKNSSQSRVAEPEQVEEQPVLQRTAEIPNKFWQMMDAYCGPVPQETVTWLEKMEKPISEEYFEIPHLGKPFGLVWAEEELAHEEKEGHRISETSTEKSSVDKILKKAMESLNEAEPCPYGSLTQRLISAFVQENIIAPPETSSGSDEKSGSSSSDQSATAKISKAASVPHTTKLEARIKAELVEQGILEASSESDKEDDEVLTELKRCQQELRAVSTRNREIISQLLKLVRHDIKKQELMKKIEVANTEVVDQYRKISAARQKKRNLMKKEKDVAMKALKERENLVKQLEQLG